MIPAQCMVNHNPPFSYGDCVRACVASLLELPTEEVRHFFKDGCDGATGQARMSEWLLERSYAPFFVHTDGAQSLAEVLQYMAVNNPNVFYMLFGSTESGGHVVIGRGGEIVHNPAWTGGQLVGPQSNGFWTICVLTRA